MMSAQVSSDRRLQIQPTKFRRFRRRSGDGIHAPGIGIGAT
jgi:hypothetical protein